MSLQDGIFAEEVENDITLFSNDARRKRVLVFPPVNNYRRFIIHQLVQDHFADLLKTFSIGQGIARRTVVCYQSDILSNPKLNGVPSGTCHELTDSFPLDTACGAMGVEEFRRSPEDSTSPEHSRMRQVKTSPAVGIYRPPAARRVGKDSQSSSTVPIINDSSCSSSAKANRQRRPDRAVYVPKHRRSTEADDSSSNGLAQIPDEIISPPCRSRCNRTRTSSPSHKNNDSFRKHVSPQDHDRNQVFYVESSDKLNSSFRSSSDDTLCYKNNDERSDTSVYVENFVDIRRTSKLSLTEDYSSCGENSDELFYRKEIQCETGETFARSLSSSSNDTVTSIVTNNCRIGEAIDSPLASNPARRNSSDFDIISECSSSMSSCTMKKSERRDSNDRDEQTNNKNLCEPRTLGVSNVLIISETKERDKEEKTVNVDKESATITSVCPPEKKPKKVARVKSKPASPPSPPIKLNRDECDWDSLFDDNGECLDPTLIEELTAAVGEVTIEQPKNDYKSFSRPIEVSSDEFAHVIEIYNFPSDFKTSDLATVFGPWKNGGFELKWVDDTHCLGVFSSPLVAAEVLGSDHPFVKTRPLSAATSLSKTKARKSVEFLQPYKSRPQTCAALARRLVTGALGVKLATARQEREQEKLLLREAKEKRRLANKQREDVWEGIITEK